MPKRPRQTSSDDNASFFAAFSTVSDRTTTEIDKRSDSAETSVSVLSFFDSELRSIVSTTEQPHESRDEDSRHNDHGDGSDARESDREHYFSEQQETDESYSSIEQARFDEGHDDEDESAEESWYKEEEKRAKRVAREFERMVSRGISTPSNNNAKCLTNNRTKQKLRKDLKETGKDLPTVNSLLENLLRESRDKRQPKTDRPALYGVDCGQLPTQFSCDFDNSVTATKESKRVKVGRTSAVVTAVEEATEITHVEPSSSDRAPALVEKFVPQINRLSMVTELYGFQYNLESVFITDCILCLDANREPERVSVLVIRDRLGVENYWFPARRLLHLCGFLNLRRTVKHRCPPNSAKRFSELRRVYEIKSFDLGGNHIYLNEEGVNGIFYGSRFRENIGRIDLVRVGVNHFYRARRFVVGELIKQLANEYIQWCLPPV